MADIKTILAWADDVCATALTEARSGDTALVNRIGANSALKLYFDNVHGLKSVKADAFAAYYPGQFKEITRLYEDYQREQAAAAATDKVSALEESLAELKKLVTAQAEALKALAEAKAPPASKKKPAPAVEADDAESEA